MGLFFPSPHLRVSVGSLKSLWSRVDPVLNSVTVVPQSTPPLRPSSSLDSNKGPR